MQKQHGSTLVIILFAFLIVIVSLFVSSRLLGQKKPSTKADTSAQIVDVMPPCGSKATIVDLGVSYTDQKPAQFTTGGGDIYITATDFPHGGYFDQKEWLSEINLGLTSKMPVVDESRSTITNTVKTLNVKENKYTKVNLPSESYWLLSSNGGRIKIASCGQISAI